MAVPWPSSTEVLHAPVGCVSRFGGRTWSGAVSPHSLAVDFVLMCQLLEYSSTFIIAASQGLWGQTGWELGLGRNSPCSAG